MLVYAHLRFLHLVVALDDVRIGRRGSFGLIRGTLTTLLALRRSRRASLRWLVLLGLREAVQNAALLLPGKLSVARLAPHGTIACLRTSSGRLLVRNDIIRSSSIALGALAIGHLMVCVVRIWVLKDDVPGVEEAGKEAETTQRDVDEGICSADAFLNPYYIAD